MESVGGAAAPRPATRDADIGVEDVLVEEGLRVSVDIVHTVQCGLVSV